MNHDVISYKRFSSFTNYTCKRYRPIIGNICFRAILVYDCYSPIFQSYGNVAVSVDILNRRVSRATISFLISNRNLECNWSSLGDLSVFMAFNFFKTFSSVISIDAILSIWHESFNSSTFSPFSWVKREEKYSANRQTFPLSSACFTLSTPYAVKWV